MFATVVSAPDGRECAPTAALVEVSSPDGGVCPSGWPLVLPPVLAGGWCDVLPSPGAESVAVGELPVEESVGDGLALVAVSDGRGLAVVEERVLDVGLAVGLAVLLVVVPDAVAVVDDVDGVELVDGVGLGEAAAAAAGSAPNNANPAVTATAVWRERWSHGAMADLSYVVLPSVEGPYLAGLAE